MQGDDIQKRSLRCCVLYILYLYILYIYRQNKIKRKGSLLNCCYGDVHAAAEGLIAPRPCLYTSIYLREGHSIT